MKKLQHIYYSWDLWAGILVALTALFLLPSVVNEKFLLSVYNVGITVLSIVFAVYFAALATIVSSPDDEFASFLEEDGSYTKIITNFKITLWLLFLGLMMSIAAYLNSSFIVEQGEILAHISYKCVLCPFIFIFTYSLSATVMASNDAIKFAHKRTEFLAAIKRANSKKTEKPPR